MCMIIIVLGWPRRFELELQTSLPGSNLLVGYIGHIACIGYIGYIGYIPKFWRIGFMGPNILANLPHGAEYSGELASWGRIFSKNKYFDPFSRFSWQISLQTPLGRSASKSEYDSYFGNMFWQELLSNGGILSPGTMLLAQNQVGPREIAMGISLEITMLTLSPHSWNLNPWIFYAYS